jgi:hypothetical protein
MAGGIFYMITSAAALTFVVIATVQLISTIRSYRRARRDEA